MRALALIALLAGCDAAALLAAPGSGLARWQDRKTCAQYRSEEARELCLARKGIR